GARRGPRFGAPADRRLGRAARGRVAGRERDREPAHRAPPGRGRAARPAGAAGRAVAGRARRAQLPRPRVPDRRLRERRRGPAPGRRIALTREIVVTRTAGAGTYARGHGTCARLARSDPVARPG